MGRGLDLVLLSACFLVFGLTGLPVDGKLVDTVCYKWPIGGNDLTGPTAGPCEQMDDATRQSLTLEQNKTHIKFKYWFNLKDWMDDTNVKYVANGFVIIPFQNISGKPVILLTVVKKWFTEDPESTDGVILTETVRDSLKADDSPSSIFNKLQDVVQKWESPVFRFEGTFSRQIRLSLAFHDLVNETCSLNLVYYTHDQKDIVIAEAEANRPHHLLFDALEVPVVTDVSVPMNETVAPTTPAQEKDSSITILIIAIVVVLIFILFVIAAIVYVIRVKRRKVRPAAAASSPSSGKSGVKRQKSKSKVAKKSSDSNLDTRSLMQSMYK